MTRIFYIFEVYAIMKSKFLLPNQYKKLGWVLFILGVGVGIPTVINEWHPELLDFTVFNLRFDWFPNIGEMFILTKNNILNEIAGISTIAGGILVAFSKESDEDELITKLRLDCLVWAIYWYYGIMLFAFLFVYDLSFYWIMVFNMFMPLILFIIRFNWLLTKFRKSTEYEEQY